MEQELAALKKQVRRQGLLLRWTLGGWALGASLLLLGAGKPTPASEGPGAGQELKLRRLAIVDEKGVERLVLEGSRREIRMDGKTLKTQVARHGLTLHNANGDEVGGMGILDNGVSAIILDGQSPQGTRERVGFNVLPNGSSSFFVNDPQGQARAFVTVDENGNTLFKLQDAQERPQVDVRIQPDGKVEWSGAGAPGKSTPASPSTPPGKAH